MKTIICDIDGTLTEYMGGGHKAIMENDHIPCPGVVDKMRGWEAHGHRIILITGRRESVRQRTEDELRRLKGNAKYLRKVYLYPELPFNAYLSSDNNQDNLILVNRKPVPIQINSLVDVTKNQEFKIKNSSSKFILEKNMPGVPGTPKKITFECPNNNCFVDRKIEDLRISAKVVGTKKNTLIKINNWVAYD